MVLHLKERWGDPKSKTKSLNGMMIKSKSNVYLQQRCNRRQMEPNEKQRVTELCFDHKRKNLLA